MLTRNPKPCSPLFNIIILVVFLQLTCGIPINETAQQSSSNSTKLLWPSELIHLFSRPTPTAAPTSRPLPLLIFIPAMPSHEEATGFISFQETVPEEHSKNIMAVLPVVQEDRENYTMPYPSVYANKPSPTENSDSFVSMIPEPPESYSQAPAPAPQSSHPNDPDPEDDDEFDKLEELLSQHVLDPLPPSLAFDEEIPKKCNH